MAGRRCFQEHGRTGRPLVGGVGCGPCWERAIRDDERFVVEFGLPREVEPDLSYVDEVAVERAMRGDRVFLMPHERRFAAEYMEALGMSRAVIVSRLHISGEVLAGLLPISGRPSRLGLVA